MNFPSLISPFGMRRILHVDVVQVLREDLTLERTWVNRNVQHAWEIPWPVLIDANRITLDNFFKACRGRIESDIVYVDPYDSVTYSTCRLNLDELPLSGLITHWTGTVKLIELPPFKALKAAVATFPTSIPWQPPYIVQRGYHTVITAQPDGAEKAYEDYANADGIMRWGVGGDVLINSKADALLGCWEGNGGPWASFAFTDLFGTAWPTCHFVENEITHTLVAPGVNSIRCTVEQLK